MVRKLLSATLILMLSLAGYAAIPRSAKGSLLKSARESVSKASVTTLTESEKNTYGVERPDPGQNNRLLQQLLRTPELQPLAFGQSLHSQVELLEKGPGSRVAQKSATPLKSKAPVSATRAMQAPKLVTGSLISKDVSYNGSIESYRHNLTATSTAGEYTYSNPWGMDTTVVMKINATTGEVSVPPAVIYRHSTYGDISMIPLVIQGNSIYMAQGDLKGKLNDDGSISLGTWGVVVTETVTENGETKPGQYYGQIYNIFTESQSMVPNTEVSGYNVSKQEMGMYQCYVEQSGVNTVNFYGFCNINRSDVLSARLTASKKIVMSPQTVFTNLMYGNFCNYPATFEYNATTAKWSVRVDSKSNMVFSDQGQGVYKLPGWVVSQRLSPSSLIQIAMNDVSVITDAEIAYPETGTLTLKGAGTEASPYIIENPAHLTMLASLNEAGSSFEGVYFALGADLNFANIHPQSYVPVGTVETPFQGVLSGAGHTISNLSIDGKGFANTGLFGVIGDQGKVENLTLANCRLTGTGLYLGAVAATNYGTISNVTVSNATIDGNGEVCGGIVGVVQGGTIAGCSFTGTVKTVATGAAIAGYAISNGDVLSNITDCHAQAIVSVDGYESAYNNYQAGGLVGIAMRTNILRCYYSGILEDLIGRHYMGGITGYASSASIRESFNTAAIMAKRVSFGSGIPGADDGDTETGGLVGYISGGEIIDSYNAGTILKTDKSNNVGGLVGYLGVGYSSTSGAPMVMVNKPVIRNCYNSGQLITSCPSETRGLVGSTFLSTSYAGPGPMEVCISECYYDKQIMGLEHIIWGKSTSELTSALPKGFDASVWSITAGRYPVLATGKGTQAQTVSATPLVLRADDNSTKVKVSFQVPATGNATWALNYDEAAQETATETQALRMSGETVTVKDKYSNSIVNLSSADSWSIKLYRLAVVPKLFSGDGTESSPFLLKELKDFKNLHEAVAVYNQGHYGDHFALASDIDFQGTPEFKGIGYGSQNEFNGTLDGRQHTVSGLKFDAGVYDAKGAVQNTSTICTGFVSFLGKYGTVRNVRIGADNDIMHFSYGGMVVGVNNGGAIEGCRNYATTKGLTSYIGGICGYNVNGGKISGCYNAGEVYFGTMNAGGITGYNGTNCQVSFCQNDGNTIRKSLNSGTAKTSANTVGGIVGTNYGKIITCVNNATVSAFDKVGGIAGYSSNFNGEGDVTGCVNNGVVYPIVSTLNRGAIIGAESGTVPSSNNYYDASINVNGGSGNTDVPGTIGRSTSELISGKTLDGLSADDYDFRAGSYPVLRAFSREEASVSLRNMYVAFAPRQLRTNVTEDAPLSRTEGIVYTLKKNDAFRIEDGKLIAAKPEGMNLAADSITATLGSYVKGFHINTVPDILAGEGTKENPYKITNKEEWNKLATFVESSKWEYPNKFFRIEQDIDFAGDSIRLLAVDNVNFQGELDGAGHTIKNYVYRNINSIKTRLQGPNFYVGQYIGLIGTLGTTGALRNLTLQGSIDGYAYVAGAVGKNYGVVENITNNGTVLTNGGNYAAGISLYNYLGSELRKCVNNGEVNSTKTTATYFGGIAVQVTEGAIIDGCVNNGKVINNGSACGIAYDVQGGITNCVNNGYIYAKGGIMSGVVYKLGMNAYMEGCSNTSDLDLSDVKKNSISGVVGMTTARTDASTPGTGYIRNSFNTGNITGGSDLFGFGKDALAGWTVTDCYNTGNVTSVYHNAGVTTSGNAQGFLNKTGGASKEELLTVVERCYNTGDVKSNYGSTAGLIGETANYTYVADCYNLGNVSSTSTGGLTTAGLTAKLNGQMYNCYNAGDVYSLGNAVGGIFGYISGGYYNGTTGASYPAKLVNCFNIGDVTSDYTGTATQGNAGGLGGYLTTLNEADPHQIIDCYNAGNVTSDMRVAGLFGGAFRPQSIVKNCYNSGKITCRQPDSQGRYYWSGTTFTNSYTMAVNGEDLFMLSGHANCFYDAQLNPGAEFRTVAGSRKTTKEMAELSISDAYTNTGGYPVLKSFADTDAAQAGTAMLLFKDADGETYTNVTSEFTLAGAKGAEWVVEDLAQGAEGADGATPSKVLKIEGGKAIPVGSGTVKLTSSLNGFKKSFTLTVNYDASAVKDTFAGKTVKEVRIYDLRGHKVETPAAGNVYITRTVYTDGTVKTEKSVAR